MSSPEITARSAARYDKWIEKKISGRPADERAFLRCVYESGVGTLLRLEGIPAASLSLAGCTAGEHEQMRRLYEPLAAGAASDPDQFIYTLHRKLTEIGGYIRKNSLFSEFCAFFSLVSQLRINFIYDRHELGIRVTSVYIGLLLASCHYLTPEKYDLSRLPCGCSSDGEPLYRDRYYPYAGEIEALAYHDCGEPGAGQPAALAAAIRKYARAYGYTGLRTDEDLTRAARKDAFQTEEILNISPYINEYTYDMVPDTAHIYNMDTKALETMDAALEFSAAADSLNARCRTLPANGIRYDLSYSPRIPDENRLQSLTLKEISRGDRFVALYKLRTRGQDLCGYYDCRDQFFYSQFMTDTQYHGRDLATMIGCVVLYLYSAATTPGGEEKLRDFGEHFRAAVSVSGKNRYPISVTAHPLGGELRNTYEDRGETPETPEAPSGDGENGQKKKTLQGYIRKLAPGEAPSGEDRAREKELGFALAEDEVYVGPSLG